MMRGVCSVILLIGAQATYGGAAENTIREIRGQTYLVRDVLIPPEEFSPAAVTARSEEFLAQSGSFSFARLRIFGDKASAYPLPKADHGSYGAWLRSYTEMVAMPRRTADLLVFGSDAVLQFRDEAGRIWRRTLRGRDPLLLNVLGQWLQILEISIRVVPLRRTAEKAQATVFVRTEGELRQDVGTVVYGKIRDLLPMPVISVRIRRDGWFIDDMDFPIVFAFVPPDPPPPAEAYADSSTLHCGEQGGVVACSTHRGSR